MLPNRLRCLLFTFLLCIVNTSLINAQNNAAPLRLAIAGLTHDHVNWILGRKKPDVTLVGIYEPDKALALKYAKRNNLETALIYTNLNEMLDKVKPEAVSAFGSILNHRSVVEACAPRGIHVMVEKPLATTVKDALAMEALAKKYNIQLLTNFETSWYPTTVKTYQLANDSNALGIIRKVVVHDGHEGPKEIGVSNEFFNWLTDPVQNGGGALVDFGCYGANLMTYLMKGEQPLSVTAVTQHFKPAIYPKVEDEATIVVTYPTAQCIIQASWNWPFSRKDMEVYGDKGYVVTIDKTRLRQRLKGDTAEQARNISLTDVPVYDDPFSYLADVLRHRIMLPEKGVYSLPVNVMVVRILEAARTSAKTGKAVLLKD